MDAISDQKLTPKFNISRTLAFIARFTLMATLILSGSPAWSDFLTQVQVVYDNENGINGLRGAKAIVVSPDGKHVYIAGYWDDGIAVFARNSNDGKITFVEFEGHRSGADDGLDSPEYLSFSPDGKHLYVANGDAIAVFLRNQSTGELSFAGYYDNNPFSFTYDSRSIKVTPNGNHVIVTLKINGDILIYERSPETGLLTFLTGHDYSGLNDFEDVVISPDGKYFYVSNSSSDAVHIYSIDSSSGASTYIDYVQDGENGVDGLNGPVSLAISPDGESLYCAATTDFAVSVFSRNLSSGKLDYVEIQRDDINGVDGLDGVSHVIVSPDGRYVYSVGENDNALTAFQRNDTNSKLSFLETKKQDVNGVVGLRLPTQSAISPDGAFVYVASSNSNAVSVFRTSGGNIPPPPTPGSFQINAGLNGSWFYPGTDGQGFLIDVFPESSVMFVAWFTYDTEQPDESVTAALGDPSQRWLTAQGVYADNQAVLDVYVSGGGLFDMYPPAPTREKDGTLTIEFSNCNAGTVTYDIPSIGRQGIIPIERIVTENVPLCESLNEMMQ